MTRKKIKLKVNVYEVVARAVEEGIKMGYRRAHKYNSHPDEDTILDYIHGETMNSLCEVIDFDA